MISVVIPLYNKAPFVAKTIKSVLDQTFPNFELIVVNDGSTDSSETVLEQFRDSRLKVISIQRSGVSLARNTGIKAARHDWIAFLDADDWWEKTFLEEIWKCIQIYPNYKLFASGRSHVFVNSEIRYDNKILPEDGDVGTINFFQVISKYLPPINSSNSVIHKEYLYGSGLFNVRQHMHEDHDLWIRLSVGQEVVFVNKNLSYYRKTQTTSASKMNYAAEDFCSFIETLITIKDKISATEQLYFRTYCNRFVLLTYIKNYSNYSKAVDEKVANFARQILTGKHKLIFNILKMLPYKKTYPLFKSLQTK